jgi:signal transduction histidine kinase
MNAQAQVVLIAAGCAGAVGAAGIGAIRLLRRAPLRLSLQAAAAIAVLAVVAGTLGTANAMFISRHDLGVVTTVCAAAGLVAFGLCWLLGRQVEAGSRALRQAARSLGREGAGFSPPDGPMAAELAALSRELAATAARLRESRERERRMERSRRQLVAWVSHDLRTPLAGLRAMTEALEDGIAADAGRYHRQIRAEVTRLSAMVDDLFELSRIESGTLSLSLDEIEAGDLVSDAVAGMEALARARGVRLAGVAGGPLPVRADARELSRALANLLANAIRHTPEGGRVRVAAAAEAGGVLMTVTDGCGGIPEADLASVFDLAWRGTGARTPGADGGAGLGLAIVRGIVEAHQGRVSVVNTGGGCRFEVRLPASTPREGNGSEDGRVAGEQPGPRPAGLLIPGL